jgi:hypothetical protein
MLSDVRNKISRLEKRAAQQTQEPKLCICRWDQTRFHNAECLDALLMRMPLVCPVHGLRQLGRLWQTPTWNVLRTRIGNDNEFCPCPPHPWRSFVQRKGPRTWEERAAAYDAWHKLPEDPSFNFQEAKRRIHAVGNRYSYARWEWFDKGGHKSPNRQELLSRLIKGVRQNADQS